MTKEKVTQVGVPSSLLRWCKHLSYLLPFLLFAAVVGTLLNAGFSYNSDIDFSKTRHTVGQRVAKIVVAKDPGCRQAVVSTVTRTNNVLPDYDIEEKPKITKEPIVIPELWKESNLFNVTNFRWVLNNESICQVNPAESENTRLLPVLVYSLRDHFDQRNVVRKTWGSLPIYKRWDLRLIFLLGESEQSIDENSEEADNPDYSTLSPNDEIERLEEEQAKYGDLVVGSFVDTLRNKTMKHLMGYKWILNFCSNASFVMKTEDDKFVDVMRWIDWRNEDLETIESAKNNELDGFLEDEKSVPDLYCNVFGGMKPLREENSGYFASMEDWPEDHYFDYCSSWAYGITVDLIKKMYWMSSQRRYFWIDNAYFGALFELVKNKFVDETFVMKDAFDSQSGNKKKYRAVCAENGTSHFDLEREFGAVVDVGSGDLFEKDMMCLWNKTLHDSHYFH